MGYVHTLIHCSNRELLAATNCPVSLTYHLITLYITDSQHTLYCNYKTKSVASKYIDKAAMYLLISLMARIFIAVLP